MPTQLTPSSVLSALILFFLIAVIIERLVEMTLGWWQVEPEDQKAESLKTTVTYLLGITLGIVICCIGNLNIFKALGFDTDTNGGNPVLFRVLSGIAIGSGTQFLHDWMAIMGYKKDQMRLKINGRKKKPAQKKQEPAEPAHDVPATSQPSPPSGPASRHTAPAHSGSPEPLTGDSGDV